MEEDTGGISRRTFLGRSIAAIGALIAAVVGGAGFGYFISPVLRGEGQDEWIDVGAASSFPPGVPTQVEFTHRQREAWVTTERKNSAWILTMDGKNFTVYDPHCTHLGCPYRWNSQTHEFECPCHGGVFSVTGKVLAGPPPRPLDHYPVKVADGRILVQVSALRAAALKAKDSKAQA